jgi:hypothetical protein
MDLAIIVLKHLCQKSHIHINGSPSVTTTVSAYLLALATTRSTLVGGCKAAFQLSLTSTPMTTYIATANSYKIRCCSGMKTFPLIV